MFNSKKYWNKRYKKGGNSGAGSYNELAKFKGKVINNFIEQNQIKSIIDYGVGDGNQLKLINTENLSYTGIDVSEFIIAKCKEEFKDDKTKKFIHVDNIDKELKGELVLSCDVVHHLIEENVYKEYMVNLFSMSNRYVIIYAPNVNFNEATHVKKREFIEYIFDNYTKFNLIKRIKGNIGSPFYVFQKNNTYTPTISSNILQVTKDLPVEVINVNKIKNIFHGYNYYWFNDENMYKYIQDNQLEEFPNLVNHIKSLSIGQHKADIFRYYWLYLNGGIFMDDDLMIEKKINFKNNTFVSVKSYHNDKNLLFNGFIACSKFNPIIYKALKKCYSTRNRDLTNNYHLFCSQLFIIYQKLHKNQNTFLLQEKKSQEFVNGIKSYYNNVHFLTHSKKMINVILDNWKTYIKNNLFPIIKSLNVQLEGNIYSSHLTFKENPEMKDKQSNFYHVLKNVNPETILEIGFNAGFSSLLMKMLLPNVNITCVDLNSHKYVMPCFNKIISDFDNLNIIPGSSYDVGLPKLINENKKFDFIHIDGDHSLEGARKDIDLCLKLCHSNTVILFDDTNLKYLDDLCSSYVKKGILKDYHFKEYLNNQKYKHRFLKINIQENENEKDKYVFIHNLKKNGKIINNIGDLYSSLYRIYPNIVNNYEVMCLHNDIQIDNITKEKLKDKIVILGGGGLIDLKDEWNSKINFIIDKSKKTYFFGPGYNNENSIIKTKINFNHNNIAKIGIRDINNNYGFVPCPSCLLLEKYKNNKNLRKYGIVEHCQKKIPNINNIYEKISMIYENDKSIDTILEFISSTENLIVNSYHAYYFSVLLGKKVLLYENWSNKFNNIFSQNIVLYNNKLDLDSQFSRLEIHSEYLNKYTLIVKEYIKDILAQKIPVYISLTSIYKNQHILLKTLQSIMKQTRLPDKIFLYLSEEAYILDTGFKDKKITNSKLLKYINDNSIIDIKWVKNIGSYRKLLPLLKDKWDEDCIIITIDDDTIYDTHLIENLVNNYYKHKCVIGYRGFTPSFDKLENFDYFKRAKLQHLSLYNFLTGKGGILYKPEFFHKTKNLIFNDKIYLNTCDKQDDIWFYIVRILNNINCYVGKRKWMKKDLTNGEGLFSNFNNIKYGSNNKSFKNTFKKLKEQNYKF